MLEPSISSPAVHAFVLGLVPGKNSKNGETKYMYQIVLGILKKMMRHETANHF